MQIMHALADNICENSVIMKMKLVSGNEFIEAQSFVCNER